LLSFQNAFSRVSSEKRRGDSIVLVGKGYLTPYPTSDDNSSNAPPSYGNNPSWTPSTTREVKGFLIRDITTLPEPPVYDLGAHVMARSVKGYH
jgi:hypothetical protein